MQESSSSNSLPIATILCEKRVTVYVTGGLLREGDLSLTCSIVETSAESLYVDKAFIGAGGITLEHGVTDFHMEEVVLRKHIMSIAGQRYLLADSSKYGRNAFAKLSDLSVFDAWFTDDGFSMLHAVFHLYNKQVTPLHEAVNMASLYPAQAIGVDDTLGSIEPGKAADLIVVAQLHESPVVVSVVVGGQERYHIHRGMAETMARTFERE